MGLRDCTSQLRALALGLIILNLATVAQLQAVEEDHDLAGCSVTFDGNIFNLQNLSRSETQGDYQVTYNPGTGDNQIYFNICEFTWHKCSDNLNDFGNFINSNNTCVHLTSDDISDIAVSLINEDLPDMGLILSYVSTTNCDTNNVYVLDVQLNCEFDRDTPSYALDTSSLSNQCRIKVIMDTKEACPAVSFPTLYRFFEQGAILYGFLFMAIGGFLVIMGGKLFQITLFLSSTLIVTIGVMLFLFAVVFPYEAPLWLAYLCLVVALGMGLSIGYAAYKWYKVGLLLMGGAVGFIIGLLLYSQGSTQVTSSDTAGDTNGLLVFFLIVIFCTVLVGVLCMVFFDYAIIVFSAIIGSYLLVRGVSVFLGGFPNEILIIMDIQNDSISELGISFLAYFLAIIVIATTSIILQIMNRDRNQDAYNFRKYDFKYRRQE